MATEDYRSKQTGKLDRQQLQLQMKRQQELQQQWQKHLKTLDWTSVNVGRGLSYQFTTTQVTKQTQEGPRQQNLIVLRWAHKPEQTRTFNSPPFIMGQNGVLFNTEKGQSSTISDVAKWLSNQIPYAAQADTPTINIEPGNNPLHTGLIGGQGSRAVTRKLSTNPNVTNVNNRTEPPQKPQNSGNPQSLEKPENPSATEQKPQTQNLRGTRRIDSNKVQARKPKGPVYATILSLILLSIGGYNLISSDSSSDGINSRIKKRKTIKSFNKLSQRVQKQVEARAKEVFKMMIDEIAMAKGGPFGKDAKPVFVLIDTKKVHRKKDGNKSAQIIIQFRDDKNPEKIPAIKMDFSLEDGIKTGGIVSKHEDSSIQEVNGRYEVVLDGKASNDVSKRNVLTFNGLEIKKLTDEIDSLKSFENLPDDIQAKAKKRAKQIFSMILANAQKFGEFKDIDLGIDNPWNQGYKSNFMALDARRLYKTDNKEASLFIEFAGELDPNKRIGLTVDFDLTNKKNLTGKMVLHESSTVQPSDEFINIVRDGKGDKIAKKDLVTWNVKDVDQLEKDHINNLIKRGIVKAFTFEEKGLHKTHILSSLYRAVMKDKSPSGTGFRKVSDWVNDKGLVPLGLYVDVSKAYSQATLTRNQMMKACILLHDPKTKKYSAIRAIITPIGNKPMKEIYGSRKFNYDIDSFDDCVLEFDNGARISKSSEQSQYKNRTINNIHLTGNDEGIDKEVFSKKKVDNFRDMLVMSSAEVRLYLNHWGFFNQKKK